MQGQSGIYAFNGTNITMSPSDGGWEDKDVIGIDGFGHSIYPAVTEFNMEWGLMHTVDFKQLQDIYLTTISTGTVVVDLPKWGDATYIFYSYSGTIISRPTVGKYFAEYVKDVKLVVSNIRIS